MQLAILFWKLKLVLLPQLHDDKGSVSAPFLSRNAFGYVLTITSFVVAWLETWFLDFKVLTQEADDERGGRNVS